MDSSHIDNTYGDSHQSRSRADKYAKPHHFEPSIADIGESVNTSSPQQGGLSSGGSGPSPAYQPVGLRISANLNASQVLQNLAKSALPLQDIYASDWTYPPTAPSSKLDPAPELEPLETRPRPQQSYHQAPSATTSYPRDSMSTVGIQQYEHRLHNMGVRPTFTWPTFEAGQSYHQPNLDNYGNYSTPVTTAAPESKAISYSPPTALFTAEQRDSKRQRDVARRASKNRARRERSASTSYNTPQPNVTDYAPRSMPHYPPMPRTNAAEQSTSGHGMASSYQNHLSGNATNDMYGGGYQIPHQDFPIGDYSSSYPPHAPENQITYPRPSPNSSSLPHPSHPHVHSHPQSQPHSHSHSHSHSFSNSHSHLPPPPLASGEPVTSIYSGGGVGHSSNSNPPPLLRPPQQQQPSSSGSSMSSAMPMSSSLLLANIGSQEAVRVVQSRPKPQCWDHGCNGRQFSTFSNLLRHQREKSGAAAKSSCPKCGAEFTRTTARNGHMAHEKCKQRKDSS